VRGTGSKVRLPWAGAAAANGAAKPLDNPNDAGRLGTVAFTSSSASAQAPRRLHDLVNGGFRHAKRAKLSLLLVPSRKLVGVAQHDFPLAIFAAVGLGTAKRPGLRTISGMPDHVFQVHGVGEVITYDCHDVLRGAIRRLDAGGCPVEPRADLLPAALVPICPA
jgi:hypothetical protein